MRQLTPEELAKLWEGLDRLERRADEAVKVADESRKLREEIERAEAKRAVELEEIWALWRKAGLLPS